jgi:hypothetical protein
LLVRFARHVTLWTPVPLLAEASRWRAGGIARPPWWIGRAQLFLLLLTFPLALLPFYFRRTLRASTQSHPARGPDLRAVLPLLGQAFIVAAAIYAFALLRLGFPPWQFYVYVGLAIGGGAYWIRQARQPPIRWAA